MANLRFASLILAILFVEFHTVTTEVNAQDAAFRFLATGDLPYSEAQDGKFRRLLKQSEDEDFAFLMHVGDFKAQSVPCSDDEFTKIRDLFQSYPKPVVYTPGDNEWTDCHGVGSDPIERLKQVRQLFYSDPKTLRLDQLHAVPQSHNPKYATYVENYRFSRAGVLFIVAHVVGSGNNLRPDDPPAMEEYRKRNEANLAFLNESFAEALKTDVPGVAVVIHANPDFENGSGEGFKPFLSTMRSFLSKYKKPVVCIHGDSHYYRIDKPLKSEAGATYLNFTRMEVFGSPNVAGVVVTIDPSDSQVFSYRPYYVEDN
ncbi:MAG: hypothetical protein CMJ64_23025 [Planctomycetaceae bacterium]|nr:hypothetical protein [Planctomycetaceae bacterium]